MGEITKIYFDEGGDFSVGNDPTDLLIIAAVMSNSSLDIQNASRILKNKLQNIGYDGDIHTGPLVRMDGIYKTLSPQQRRDVFWALYNFACTSLRTWTFIFDKHSFVDRAELFYSVNDAMQNLFDDIITQAGEKDPRIYYDGGQRPLMKILYGHTSKRLSPDNYYADFKHDTNRFFQAADQLTYIHRVKYKLEHNIPLTKSDQLFFTKDNLRRILKITPPIKSPE